MKSALEIQNKIVGHIKVLEHLKDLYVRERDFSECVVLRAQIDILNWLNDFINQ